MFVFQYMFTDEHSNFIFTTQDYGRTVSSVLVPFKPTKLMFHKTKCSYVLGMNYNPTGSSDVSRSNYQPVRIKWNPLSTVLNDLVCGSHLPVSLGKKWFLVSGNCES